MASEDKNSITISRSNAGFPPYLDFDALRREGIGYLGNLAGQLWTDHNVHDPGITILEELCYALLDLGYRTNLPVADILSKNPADSTIENNFFTAAQILSCNPQTITDYRKLLIDIEGVRNAWLVPARDISNLCDRNLKPVGKEPATTANNLKEKSVGNTSSCEDFLNGIYHVLIETAQDVDKDFQNEDPAQEAADKAAFIKAITDSVRNTLMAHRNLCEDFEDIFILCKLDTGVCASIEIKEGFEADAVYMAVANRLHDFFSNAPQFYTLQQMLDNGKSMDEIFAGRPFSKQSHGFVDTAELESITLKRELHTSDIYNAIFEIEGVKKITGLRLMTCGKKCHPQLPDKNTYWRFHLPENHIPVFSINCSGFEFTRNGKLLPFDASQFDTQLELGWMHSGKVLYPQTSAYLNAPIPNAVYHDDLDNYYSIQNDFPSVYGIGEGDLADSASDLRKSQALQLKGYLFFFDQMLANYLAQLKNIRQLFSFTHPADIKSQHTYFLNSISTVPELNKLLRFGTDTGDNGLGAAGTLLAFPISKAAWQAANIVGLTAENLIASFSAYTFNSLFGLYESTDLLRNDLVNEGESIVTIYQSSDGYYLYTIESSAAEFLLLGKGICNTQAEAQRLAASVQYAGVFENNYRSFLTASNTFTFNIELNIDTYTDYLGILVESDELYSSRRKDFLSHLLSRFAETFTDFVLLNWNPAEENKSIAVVENYLTHYPDLSRNRGRAYNYLDIKDKERSVSGFERKVKALAGIPEWGSSKLCPFSVELYDESYIIDLSTTGITGFLVREKFDMLEDALHAVTSIIKTMSDPAKYAISYMAEKRQYQILLDYGSGTPAVYPTSFNNSNAAEALAGYLAKSFSQQAPAGSVFENSWTWAARIKDNAGNIVSVSGEEWTTAAEANAAALKLAEQLNDRKRWKAVKEHPFHGKLFYDKTLKNNFRFVDLTHFNIDINDTIIGKPGRFTYDALDKGTNSFKISPTIDFENGKAAENHCHRILIAASDKTSYSIKNSGAGLYAVEILLDGSTQAINAMVYASTAEAEIAIVGMVAVINQYIYTLDLLKTAVGWKFNYQLGYTEDNRYVFSSDDEYSSPKAALEAEQVLYKHVGELSPKLHKTAITLAAVKGKAIPAVSFHATTLELTKAAAGIQSNLDDQHKIYRMHGARTTEALKAFVNVDAVDKFGTYVYRVIDKNRVPAVYTESFPDKTAARNKRKIIASLSKKAIRDIPGVCLGGDVYTEEKDNSNTIWYRYQLMFYNVTGIPGNQLVLFESVNAFGTSGEALQAFNDNYLQLLLMASDKNSYGKYISTTPIPIPASGSTINNDWVAFIPAASLQILQDSFGATWNDKLIEIVKAYPIKIIDTSSVEFAALFCADYKFPASGCVAAEKNWKYYFSIPIDQGSLPTGQEWRSTCYYDTADEAMAEFRYFCRLLLFTGNYFTDCACTKTVSIKNCELTQSSEFSYKIFVHEVLAQSINWFEKASDAWGPLGIEKFICATQKSDSLKKYQRRDDCCYSFYVTCGNGLLEHPCTYDTEIQRRDAINSLYNQFVETYNKKSYGYTQTAGNLLINDKEGKAFAEAHLDPAGQKDPCDGILQLTEDILARNTETVYGTDGYLHCSINNSTVRIQSIEQRINIGKPAQDKWIEEWTLILWYWACYFPVTRTSIKTTNAGNSLSNKVQYKYCIEIKLPSFSLCADEAQPYIPCGKDNGADVGSFCNIAWKSACCFSTCKEAEAAVGKAFQLLLDRNNYHAVFDCSCNSYGVTLNTLLPSLVSAQQPSPAASDIIAVNPQCYETGNEVCLAVDTCLRLVNSQGLHLVEHILLRPFSQTDCECREKIAHCNTWDECSFPSFIEKGGGACSEEDAAFCFRPGHDPYSFIATVVLPAWSDRFRTEQGRLALEQVLYAEAPAHVLLRILWLKPWDFCRFETAFFEWKQSQTAAKTCDNSFDICEFLRLLFSTYYDCLPPCTECIPCADPGTIKLPSCFEQEKLLKIKNGASDSTMNPPFAFLNQVNETFCFSDYCHKQELVKDIGTLEKTSPELKMNEPAKAPVAIKKEIPVSRKPIALAKQETEKTAIKKSAPHKAPAVNIQLKAKTVNARYKKYKTAVAVIIEQTPGNPLAIKADRFISSQQADAGKLEILCSAILENPKADNGVKKLNKTQQLQLMRAAICFYVDKISFNGKEAAAYKPLGKIVTQIKKAGIDTHPVFTFWDAAAVATIEPDVNIDFVRQLITGSKK